MKRELRRGDQVILEQIILNTEDSGETIVAKKGTIISRYRHINQNYHITDSELYVVLFDDGSVQRGITREILKPNYEDQEW